MFILKLHVHVDEQTTVINNKNNSTYLYRDVIKNQLLVLTTTYRVINFRLNNKFRMEIDACGQTYTF